MLRVRVQTIECHNDLDFIDGLRAFDPHSQGVRVTSERGGNDYSICKTVTLPWLLLLLLFTVSVEPAFR